MRKSGVLLHVSSLTGDYGIGDFGHGTSYFIDYIANMGFSVWQILPITCIGNGNSPYSAVSVFAGNYLFIDIASLPDRWLTKEEKESFKCPQAIYKTDYQYAKTAKRQALELSFSRLTNADCDAVLAFYKENEDWLKDYALYMSLKEEYNGLPWYEWRDGDKHRTNEAITDAELRLAKRIEFYYFEQYLFYTQWKKVKAHAKARGIQIFGDMPIYVALDSVDVWSHKECFMLDKELKPTEVAGVPPDYFSADGQLWGNPLYNYDNMRLDNYAWLTGRIKHNLGLYDILRIDHFRGLYQYWAVPATAKTAKEGCWKDACKYELWEALARDVSAPNIVAEDLGIIDEGVSEYLKQTGFPGMRVVQFGFDGDVDNVHLPFNYEKNTVAYTSTHDNNTLLGWLYSLSDEARRGILDYFDIAENGWGSGGRNCPTTRAIVKEVLASVAELAIVPLQDLCGYGGDTRMNTPGVAEGNWEYRATVQAYNEIDAAYFRKLNLKYGRYKGI